MAALGKGMTRRMGGVVNTASRIETEKRIDLIRLGFEFCVKLMNFYVELNDFDCKVGCRTLIEIISG